MKQFFQSYIRFTKTERYGIIALSASIVLLLLLKWQMPRLLPPPTDTNPETMHLLTAWQQFKNDYTHSSLPFYPPASFPFDPNTIDSTTALQLGLTPKTTHLLLNWRRKGKIFYDKEAFRTLYTLPETTWLRLEPLIILPEKNTAAHRHTNYRQKPEPFLPGSVNLNTADTATLIRIKGIGAVLAQKIIARRTALGGFIQHAQLKEIYPFSDSVFSQFERLCFIPPGSHRQIPLNTASVAELERHPYIGKKRAAYILLYRDGIQQFENITQLKQVPLMNEENYRKIAPYLTLE